MTKVFLYTPLRPPLRFLTPQGEPPDDLGNVRPAPRRPQQGPAPQVDPLHRLPRQLDRLAAAADGAAAGRVEPAEAVPDAENLVRGHAVVREGEDDVLDDVVEAFLFFLIGERRKGKKRET